MSDTGRCARRRAGDPPAGLLTPTARCPHPLVCSRGVTLGYAELKKLIIDSVDKVPDGADKVITGGRLNVTRAADQLEALLAAKGAAPVATPGAQPAVQPQVPNTTVPTPLRPTPLPGGSGGTTGGPVCGTSQLAGLSSATQSSTAGSSKANLAIDGECRKRRVWQGSCAQTRESTWAAVYASGRCSSAAPLVCLTRRHPADHHRLLLPALPACRVPGPPLVGGQAARPQGRGGGGGADHL